MDKILCDALTFDDVLLLPAKSSITPAMANISTSSPRISGSTYRF